MVCSAVIRGILVAATCMAGAASADAQSLSIPELAASTHIHGLAVDRTDPSRLLIATHHGLFRAAADATAERISEVQDFMGFQAHPATAGTLYASGHPATGGNLGVIASADNGATWTPLSPGLGGPVDFHQMSVSPADPSTIYGAFGDLQVSRDGGKTWSAAGAAPAGLIDLAASAKHPDQLYAATQAGLMASRDAGASWEPILTGAPVSLVEETPDGRLFAFVPGRGLLVSADGSSEFTAAGGDWGDAIVLHLAADPADPQRLFVATIDGKILRSEDGGRSWAPFG